MKTYLYLVGILITSQILTGYVDILGISVFKWLLLTSIIGCIIYSKKISLYLYDKFFLLFILCTFLSWIGTFVNGYIDSGFVLGNIINLVIIIVFSNTLRTAGIEFELSFIKGIVTSSVVQSVYCGCQYLFRHMTGYSLNRLIFSDIMGIHDVMVTRDIINEGIVIESGMNIHPSVMIPLMLIMLCFYKNEAVGIILSLLIIGITRNSTLVIAFIICNGLKVLLRYYRYFVEHKNISIKANRVILYLLGIITLLVLLFSAPEMSGKIWASFYRAINRIVISNGSRSDRIHRSYYTTIFTVMERSKLFNILFGNGLNSSGDVMTHLILQSNPAHNWAVECDPIDMLHGVGIVGFVSFYYWLVTRGIKNIENKIYLVFLISIILCGITYRVQYFWVITFELVLFSLLSRNIDFTTIIWQVKNGKK